MNTLLSVLAIWLSANFGIPAADSHPAIEFFPKETLSDLWIESIARDQGMDPGTIALEHQNHDIRAFYDDHRRAIFLASDWNPESVRDVSILVHELTHHLQNLSGRTYACSAEREKLAYYAQDTWLRLFGTSLEIEFEIDSMTLLLTTKCMH